MKIATVVLGSLCALAGTVVAQSQPTPGAPSQPFSAVAQAQNGGAGPQVTYQYGMEFVTVPGGSQVYHGGSPNDLPGLSPGVGRGAVAEDFRIGRYEVGRASWNAFFAAAEQVRQQTGQAIPWLSPAGGLSGGGQYGRTGNISWRTAAIYCNWLHNDQAVTRDAFMSGAYDVGTFGFTGADRYTDQLTHSPGARFWVPTMDQWMRAGFFDPNHNSPQYGNWWQYGTASDSAPFPALPRQLGGANYGFSTPNGEEFTVPLGAYSQVQSPWGLFDVSGASTEWIEEPFYFFGGPDTGLPTGRYHAGTYLTSSPAITSGVGRVGGQSDPVDDAYWMGFRLAAAVPAPSMWGLAGVVAFSSLRRPRRRS